MVQSTEWKEFIKNKNLLIKVPIKAINKSFTEILDMGVLSIQAIVDSNDTRKGHIAKMIVERKPEIVGIYRLMMKTDPDNFRQSAIQGVIERLKSEDIEVVIYEPVLEEQKFEGLRVIDDFADFKQESDVIVANRLSEEIKDVREKVYTRDLFSRD